MTKNKVDWNLKYLLKDEKKERTEKEIKKVKKEAFKFCKKWEKRTDYLTQEKTLKKALDDYEKWANEHGYGGNLWYYYYLKSSLNQSSARIRARLNKISEISIKIRNDIQFFELRLSKIDKKTQKRFLNSKVLRDYRHFLKRLFESGEHTLSEKEEKILNLKSRPSHTNWVKMVSSFLSSEEAVVVDEEGKKESKNFSEIISLVNSRNKKVRDSAALEFNDILKKHAKTAENEINSILQNKKIDDELREFTRPDKARHVSDSVDTKVIDTLRKTVSANFAIARDYYELKARLMGVKKLEYHERNVPYGELETRYSFDSAYTLLKKVFANLDEEFSNILDSFVKKGLIDVFPKKGKRGGAFCSYNLKSQPVYVLLNHTEKLNDVLTFAHEMGHAINDEFMRKTQNSLNFETSLATAEVASTFFEDFVLQEILKSASDEQKLSLMMQKLNDDVSTIFRQIAAYNFEWDLHAAFREKGYLSKNNIGKIFRKNMQTYMGEFVEQSPGNENWWVYWSHFRNFFYVYSYASGLLISKNLQVRVKENPDFIDKVKLFLSAGMSDSPRNIFQKLDIDISKKEFWQKGILQTKKLLKETKNLATTLKKI